MLYYLFKDISCNVRLSVIIQWVSVSGLFDIFLHTHIHRFGHLLLVLVATIGRILVQNKGEGLIHREYLIIAHDDVIKEYCNGVFWLVRNDIIPCYMHIDITAEMSKDDLIGLIDKSHLVLPSKRPLWYKAIIEYYNEQ